MPRFRAHGKAHARVSEVVPGEEPPEGEFVMFEWELTVPKDGRPPVFAIYEDREVDATPTLLQVCTGDAADLMRRLVGNLMPKEMLSKEPCLGVMAITFAVLSWLS